MRKVCPMATISGAIFDCDGTLLDSMQVWYGAFAHLVGTYGIEATDEMQRTVEPMTLPQSSAWLHENLGIGESGPALNEEIHAYMRDQYEHHIPELPGARHFLDSLRAAGIPMIVATSTTSSLVRDALRVHGMDGYFQDVVCTAEVRRGLDKDYPDVYLEALECLGTPVSETWVFEDAPFGVRTSRLAGFHVVGISTGHDGRDESFVRAWADIFTHNYDDVSLGAIQAFDDAARRPVPEGPAVERGEA